MLPPLLHGQVSLSPVGQRMWPHGLRQQAQFGEPNLACVGPGCQSWCNTHGAGSLHSVVSVCQPYTGSDPQTNSMYRIWPTGHITDLACSPESLGITAIQQEWLACGTSTTSGMWQIGEEAGNTVTGQGPERRVADQEGSTGQGIERKAANKKGKGMEWHLARVWYLICGRPDKG